ncbi:toxin-antitoxin system HicB family antitoxin [Prauserella cavernicola]|uniref:Toxin-antitoxin system HicB family antitoxin n=1 Tax=Prauserella cavernicola TaxID=2800127 RepID=A0A934V609_9PSEU|nr:toxin-antitoxin system HicB family antitoxin [Prauserella cavernicola]MBK1785710.1 toxin-antitoxin system HicB family antitoxin [Prauserella cavernicola]
MKQLIARIDDDLHAKVKAKAAAEGRSVNDLVTGLLEAAVQEDESPREWHRRMVAEGKAVAFEPDSPAPGRQQLAALMRGTGTAVSEALDWTRGER